jgi:aminoglycoside phosphotransferase (APT) family kinase protein
MSTRGELAQDLGAYLSAQAGHSVEITAIQRMSEGWESDVYAFDAPAWRSSTRILRLYFGANAGATARHEYDALLLLDRAGYPVPRVELVEPATEALGRAFLLMERIEGSSMGQRWRDPDPVVREREIARFCELFARLHALAWQHLPGAAAVPSYSVQEQLGYWASIGKSLASETLETALAWLDRESGAVRSQPLGLVHWDFHHENILIDKNDQPWIIDWTQFQLTDIRFDLAWTLTLLASERDAETADAVRRGSYAVRGWDAEAANEEMRFFEAAAAMKRLASVIISLKRGADALGMRPGAEAIMRSRLPRIAIVYHRWLELTALPLAEVEQMLAGHWEA